MTDCFFVELVSDLPCGYDIAPFRIARCHLIPKRRLKDNGVDDCWEPELWVWGCPRHHARVDGKTAPLQFNQYPADLLLWAQENDWEWIDVRTGFVKVLAVSNPASAVARLGSTNHENAS